MRIKKDKKIQYMLFLYMMFSLIKFHKLDETITFLLYLL